MPSSSIHPAALWTPPSNLLPVPPTHCIHEWLVRMLTDNHSTQHTRTLVRMLILNPSSWKSNTLPKSKWSGQVQIPEKSLLDLPSQSSCHHQPMPHHKRWPKEEPTGLFLQLPSVLVKPYSWHKICLRSTYMCTFCMATKIRDNYEEEDDGNRSVTQVLVSGSIW